MKSESKRRHDYLLETFQALEGCLFAYYGGHLASYRPMASQLRLLLHDPSKRGNRALFFRCFQDPELSRIRPIEWIPVGQLPKRTDLLGMFRVTGADPDSLEIVKMPFTVTIYQNGLQVADLDIEDGPVPIPLREWLKQTISTNTGLLTIRDTIAAVANKGGGVHVDDHPDRHLKNLQRLRPAEIGAHILFIVAIARYIQLLGIQYKQFRDKIGYDGRMDQIVFDPEHPSAMQMVNVDLELTGPAVAVQSLCAVRRLPGGNPNDSTQPVTLRISKPDD